jgi:serine/threonine-protein kinase
MTEASAHLTSSGAVMGTPAYMSPEQGMGAKLDGRSDIYSLGIILYEMVTGQVPYSAETPIAVVFKHIQNPLPSARKLVSDLPQDLEMVLLKSLAKDPADRYQSAEDFVRAIQMAIPAHTPAEKPTPAALPTTKVAAPVKKPQPAPPATPVPPVRRPVPSAPPPVSYTPPTTPPQPIYKPVSQPSIPAQKKRKLPWILVGIGLIVICCIGIALLYIASNYNIDLSSAPIPTIRNCLPLPDAPTVTARDDIPCRKTPLTNP